MNDERKSVILKFARDPVLAHMVLFKHRHPDASPPFHPTMIRDWHDRCHPYVLDMVFRGGAKSTIAEEALSVMAGFRRFRNGLIVGINWDRAAERLHAIKREIETNERFIRVFGELRGPTWTDDEIIMSNGRRLLAIGRGQALRGTKFEEMRPDLVACDDIEDRADVATPEARAKVSDWFNLDLLPACDPHKLVRMAATPLHPESLPMVLQKDPEWLTHRFPIYYLDEETGERTSSWPARFSMDYIDKLERSYVSRGQSQGFNQEYMCVAEDPKTKLFTRDMIKVEPHVHTWQATFAMIDPARTVNKNSATTGHAVWSHVGPKTVVWDADGQHLMPDAIIDLAFTIHRDFRPVWIGVEEDGLNEFLLQPLRQEQIKRGIVLPIKAFKAPKGKIDFISGLQPFYSAREIVHVKDLPALRNQLLAFPSGKIDVPNALAYMLKMKGGAPVYDSFGLRNTAPELPIAAGRPMWLALNASRTLVSGIVCQVVDGSVRVFADYMREGEPEDVLRDVVGDAQLEWGDRLHLTVGPMHFDRYNNVGLVQAAKRMPRVVRPGVPPERGRPVIRKMIERERHQMPMVQVSTDARWTLNAFLSGYARVLNSKGILADHAEEGQYRVLMEGLESFLGLTELGDVDEERDNLSYARTPDGRPYVSILRNT